MEEPDFDKYYSIITKEQKEGVLLFPCNNLNEL